MVRSVFLTLLALVSLAFSFRWIHDYSLDSISGVVAADTAVVNEVEVEEEKEETKECKECVSDVSEKGESTSNSNSNKKGKGDAKVEKSNEEKILDVFNFFESKVKSIEDMLNSDDPAAEIARAATNLYNDLADSYVSSMEMCAADDSAYDELSNLIRQVSTAKDDNDDDFKAGFKILKDNQCDAALMKYGLSSILRVLIDSPERGRRIFMKENGYGIDTVFSILNFHEVEVRSLSVLQVGTAILAGLTLDFDTHKKLIDNDVAWLMVKLLRDNDIDNTVHANCMMLLWTLATNDQLPANSVTTKEVLEFVIKSMRRYPQDRVLHERAFGFLVLALRNETVARAIAPLNGTLEIIESMKEHTQSPHIQEQGCRSLLFAALAHTKPQHFKVFFGPVQSIAFKTLMDAVDNRYEFSKGPCIGAIWHLSKLYVEIINDKDYIQNLKIPSVLLPAMAFYKKDPPLLENGCILLSFLIKLGKQSQDEISNYSPMKTDEIVYQAITENARNLSMIERCLDTLVNYIHGSDENEDHLFKLHKNGILNFLEDLIHNLNEDEKTLNHQNYYALMKERAISLIWKLGKGDGHREVLNKRKFDTLVLNEMNRNAKDVRIQTAGCLALWNMAYNRKDNKLIEKNADDTIISAMKLHEGEIMLNQCAVGLLMQLANPELNNQKRLIGKKVIPLVESVMERFQSNHFLSDLAKNTLLALRFDPSKMKFDEADKLKKKKS